MISRQSMLQQECLRAYATSKVAVRRVRNKSLQMLIAQRQLWVGLKLYSVATCDT